MVVLAFRLGGGLSGCFQVHFEFRVEWLRMSSVSLMAIFLRRLFLITWRVIVVIVTCLAYSTNTRIVFEFLIVSKIFLFAFNHNLYFDHLLVVTLSSSCDRVGMVHPTVFRFIFDFYVGWLASVFSVSWATIKSSLACDHLSLETFDCFQVYFWGWFASVFSASNLSGCQDLIACGFYQTLPSRLFFCVRMKSYSCGRILPGIFNFNQVHL